MKSISLLHGLIPHLALVLGALGMACLAYGRGMRWWVRRVPIAAAAAAALTVAVVLLVEKVWRPFPDELPRTAVIAIGAALLAIVLAVLRWLAVRSWWQRSVLPVCVLLVFVAGISEVNVYYGHFPTPGALLGVPLPDQVKLGELGANEPTVVPPSGRTLEASWTPPPGMPAKGKVAEVKIPGSTSGFMARAGLVYLPPAYLTTPRAELPVLVLLAGSPGQPRNWFDAGRLAARMDKWALAHKGLTPVVVVPDVLGSTTANPLCVDSKHGNVATYVDVDVPAWIAANLQVNKDHRKWSIGGLSSGGTCALQALVRSPEVYPTIVDMSGQDEPSLSTRKATVAALFDGDMAAFLAVCPLNQLKTKQLPPGSAAIVTVGDNDKLYRPQQERVVRELREAGVSVSYMVLPGEHNWSTWGDALDKSIPWLAARLELT